MPHDRARKINAFPTTKPQFPTQIHVLAIHEKYSFFECPNGFKGLSAEENGCARTPGGFTGGRIINLGMLARLLTGLAHTDPGISFSSFYQSLETGVFEFGIRIQEKYEFGCTESCQQIHPSGETIVR